MNYSIKKVSSIAPKELEELTRKSANAFKGDPVFSFIFKNNKELYNFLEVCIEYYIRVGDAYVCYDENGATAGLSLWNMPDGKYITTTNVIKSGMLLKYLKLILRLSPSSFYRMTKMSDLTQQHHIKEPHAYLFLLVSFIKGAGSALLSDADLQFGQYNFYLENSNPFANDKFYYKFDFLDMPVLSWNKGQVKPMRRVSKK